jgi:predicted ArsR family transcriptional regulator
MAQPSSLPTGTKLDILQLLGRREFSASQLAGQLGVSATAIRQHLAALQALGMVERRRVGERAHRPTELYHLSPEGRRAFPKRYDLLLREIVAVLAEQQGAAAVTAIVEAAARRLGEQTAGEASRWPRADAARWTRLLEWIEREFAWQAEGETTAGSHHLTIHHCPFRDLSQNDPGICGAFFPALIRSLYGDATITHTPLDGNPACCAFAVKPA